MENLSKEDQNLVDHMKSVTQNMLDQFKEGYISHDKFTEKLDAKLAEYAEKGVKAEQIDELNKSLEAQGLEIKKLSEGVDSKKTFTELFNAAFKAKKEKIEAVYNASAGGETILEIKANTDITTKAVGDITTGNVSTSGTFSALHEMINADDIYGVRLRMPWIDQYATVTRTSKATYSYTEYEPKEGDADFVAEGGTKSQVDVKATTRAISPKKCAAYSVLTEEARDDVPRMESETRGVIAKKVALKRQNGILFGDGVGENPLGLTEVAQVFDPASWPTTEKVTDPNIKDAIIACANQIYTTHNYVDEESYIPNLVVLNSADYHSLLTKKDLNNNYLFLNVPLASGGVSIEGISVIHHRDVDQGNILIGDFTKLNIINYIDYLVKMGWINEQLIENKFTLVGETRFFTYVRKLDEIAFIYDTLQNVYDGIEEVIA